MGNIQRVKRSRCIILFPLSDFLSGAEVRPTAPPRLRVSALERASATTLFSSFEKKNDKKQTNPTFNKGSETKYPKGSTQSETSKTETDHKLKCNSYLSEKTREKIKVTLITLNTKKSQKTEDATQKPVTDTVIT